MKKISHLGANLDRILSVMVYGPVRMISDELLYILPHIYHILYIYIHWHPIIYITNVMQCFPVNFYGKILWQKFYSHKYITLSVLVPRTIVWIHVALGALPENNTISNLAEYSMLSAIVLYRKPQAKLFQKHLWIEKWFIQMEVHMNQLSNGNCLMYQVNDI